LSSELTELAGADLDLALTGFDASELSDLLQEPTEDPEDEPAWTAKDAKQVRAKVEAVADRLEVAKKADEFEADFNAITNEHAQLPIVPRYSERYNAFIIICENEIDEVFIREKLGLTGNWGTDSDVKIRRSNVITVEQLRNL
jgi:hypothetical protein